MAKTDVTVLGAGIVGQLLPRLGPKLLIGWATATLASVAGLWLSYTIDLPTGALLGFFCLPFCFCVSLSLCSGFLLFACCQERLVQRSDHGWKWRISVLEINS